MKRRAVRTFFRSFLIAALLIGCAAGLLAGIYFADSGIRSQMGEEALTVWSTRQVKGGYEVEVLGMRATVGGEWTLAALKAAERASVLLPPELRFVLELLVCPPPQDS